ncbi:ankyrin repeat domain-containing protein [Wolbachia endosymbiont (group A) of Acrocera orbiculus]|uniref:ankyrin repeat domain-containing protein n=1 Tax=Wolbachia endosymbiont (group A) of Acrocera orbiculus TaxID=2953971 RepID=UPI002226914C|nr:ankyrin repeat domain-containing protein [Wolbachia endosymbiont (group A) of Acrocera orbiculus]
MAIKKEKFFEIINEVSKSEGLNENNLLERIGNKLKGVNSGVYDTYNKLKIGNTSKTFSTFNKLKINEINKMFRVSDSYKIVNYTLLHLAVECNSVPIVKLLLAKGVKVKKPTHELDGVKSQLTALHIAALHGHQEIVQLLLNNDANPLLKDSQGRTPRDIVGDVKGKKAIIEMLEEGEQRYAEAGATRRQNRQGTLPQPNNKTPGNLAVNGNNATAAVQACNARDQEENNGTTPNNRKIYVQDEDEQTSSNSIVNENNTDKVDDTLEREQAIRERDAMLQKLREAEQRLANNQKRIEQDYLHDQHLEQYTIHNGEQTFLNKSSSDDSGICFDGDGSEALGQSILENGEDIDAQDKDGVTPLHWAVADNNKELAKLLIKHGADVDARNRDKHTPLHYAAVHGYVEIAKYLIDNGANVNAQDQDEHIPLYFAVTNDNKELAKLLIKYGADRSLIKDEDLIDRLNSMCDQPSEVVPSTFSHSKTHNATETPEKAEKVEKRKAKLKELRTQLKDEQKKNELLKQKIQDLESKNTTLNSELEENENKHSKTKVLLEKAQKELAESKSCIVGHETKLKQFNKENESLTQKIKSLENENTPLEGELGKTKTNEVSLEKAGKRQMSFLKVASVNLVTMLTVGATLSIAFDLSVLPIIVVFVTSAALLASCVTYAISKPIAEPKPTTELKEVDIQGSAQRCL